jgi:ArsR family metal-binding transcriptional regulator
MLLTGYRKDVFRAECNHSFESLHCIAHLNEDVSLVLPYLNTALGGFTYLRNPPSVTFKVHGKLITVSGDRIAVNALKDEEELDKILDWLKREINQTWENRSSIIPSEENASRPKLIEILRLLPGSNCRECGQATCMVFATLAMDGIRDADSCPALTEAGREKLEAYLKGFNFDQ